MSKKDRKKLISLIAVFVVALYSFVVNEVKTSQKRAKVSTVTYENVASDAAGKDVFFVHYIDVGQGDCTLVETPGGKFVLIDAGTNDSEYELLSYLDSRKVKHIECMFLTHPHEDHIGSADAVLDSFYVHNVVKTDRDDGCSNCENLDRSIEESKNHIGTKVTEPLTGDKYVIDGIEFLVLSDGREYEDYNDSSICIRMEYGKSTFIFTGDAQSKVERDILFSDMDVSAEVLKCGHHGSSTSSCEEFLGAVEPDIAIISCGENNSYGHPHDEVLESLADRGVTVYRTDEDGNIVLKCTTEQISYLAA
ncbi:MAG: MBL fold metallo-hydrolase [Clostridia bacterium]|nr:MBL fold metallo-hydrolase [Clostridia bacterium]